MLGPDLSFNTQIKNCLNWKILLLLVIIYFPYFLNLGDLPLRTWDEARLVANASEMYENGNYLVTTFHGSPEMWNTKPPLMIWCQVFFVHLIGDEEIAYRLPSAIAGFLTCLLIMFLAIRYLKSYWLGLVAVLILITSKGHLVGHIARTGDYDALLTLFMTAYIIFFFIWTETGKTKYLHLFFATIFFSIFTKSAQGLFFLPVVFIYILLEGKFKTFFTQKWVYIDFLIVIVLIGGYYLLRESATPGYLKAVYNNELGGRLINTIESHTGKITYYIDLLWTKQFRYYCILACLGFFTSFIFQNHMLRRFIKYISLSTIIYLIIISLAQTKLKWYTAPMMPLLSILAATPVFLIFKMIEDRSGFKPIKTILIQSFLVVIFLGYPYYKTINEVYKSEEVPEARQFTLIGHFLQDALDGKHDLDGTKLYYSSDKVALEYYIRRMQKKGIDIYIADPALIRPGDHIITTIGNDKDDIKSKFNTAETFRYQHISILQINSVK